MIEFAFYALCLALFMCGFLAGGSLYKIVLADSLKARHHYEKLFGFYTASCVILVFSIYKLSNLLP